MDVTWKRYFNKLPSYFEPNFSVLIFASKEYQFLCSWFFKFHRFVFITLFTQPFLSQSSHQKSHVLSFSHRYSNVSRASSFFPRVFNVLVKLMTDRFWTTRLHNMSLYTLWWTSSERSYVIIGTPQSLAQWNCSFKNFRFYSKYKLVR